MKVLHSFQSLEQAHLAISFLEQADISAYLWDENISALYPIFNPSIGMIRIAVDENDWAKATTVLKDYLDLTGLPN